MNVNDPHHPAWSLIRLGMLLIAMTTVLWLTASNFDYTEIRAIIATFLAAASGEGIVRALTGKRK